MPGMIGMHGGLPPSDSFPFSYFNAGMSAAGHGPTDAELQIAEPQLVAAAQQYNMNAQVRACEWEQSPLCTAAAWLGKQGRGAAIVMQYGQLTGWQGHGRTPLAAAVVRDARVKHEPRQVPLCTSLGSAYTSATAGWTSTLSLTTLCIKHDKTAHITIALDKHAYAAELVHPTFLYVLVLQGYAPLVSWAHNMVASLHHPATLLPQPTINSSSANSCANSSSAEPIGMQVVMTQGSSAALDCLFRMLLNPGDPVLLEEYTYAHVVEAGLLPMR
jgi:hypothetical protein